jgi:hypothetical protein
MNPKLLPISLLLIAAFFVLVGYDNQLPVLDTDEGILLAQTFRDRNIGQYEVMQVEGYPPFILGLYHVVQRITEFIRGESVLEHSELVIRLVRLLAAGVGLITAYMIYRIGASLLTPLVGYVAAIVWVMLPSVNAQMHFALTEAWQALFITTSIWMMLQTLETQQRKWALASTLFGLLAVMSKYSAFPVLGFGIGASLWLAWSEERAWLWTTLVQIGMIVLGAYLLLNVFGASTLLTEGNAEPIQFARSGLRNLVNPTVLQYLFNAVAIQVGAYGLPLLMLVLLVGTILFTKQVPIHWRVAWAMLLVFWITHIAFVASFLVFDHLKERYFSPSSPVLVLLIAISLSLIASFVSQRLKIRYAAPLLLLYGIWITPPLIIRSQEILALSYPYSDRAFVEWSSASLEPGTLAITGLEGTKWYWRYFNPIWGNYHGPQRPLVDILLYLQQPKAKWEESNIQFVHLAGSYPGNYPTLPFAREEMLFVKAFPPPDTQQTWRGDPFYIYRLQPIQNPLSVGLGEAIELVGYDLNDEQRDNLRLRLYWKAPSLPTADYHLYLHLSSLEVHDALAQADGTPGLHTRPTNTWDDPYETLISPEYQVAIPQDLAPGQYRLLAGLYRFDTGERLLTDEGSDFVLLRMITVP